jgi:hypothetical protein
MLRSCAVLVITCLCVTLFGTTGCQNMASTSSDHASLTAGGDGAFGESPESPGYYPSDHSAGQSHPSVASR